MAWRSKPGMEAGGARTEGAFPARWRPWLIAAVLAVMVLVFLFGGNGVWHSLVLRRRVAELEASVDSLNRVNQLMQERLEKLKAGDTLTLEEEARSHGMIKPGEKVYLLMPESSKKPAKR